MRVNPLLRETIAGIGVSGNAHLEYLNYLLIQALVVFVWWPKDDLLEVLGSGDAPQTLLAAVLIAGFMVSYYSVRAGAEEVLLPGQLGLRDWAAAAPLPRARLIAGYVAGHLVQTVHMLALSSPLVLMGFAVSGGEWAPLGWSFAAILFLATFYRLAGAVVYMSIGQHGVMTFLAIRIGLLLSYALAGALLPVASHLVLASRLLSAQGLAPAGIESPPGALTGPLGFMLIYMLASLALALVLHRQLWPLAVDTDRAR